MWAQRQRAKMRADQKEESRKQSGRQGCQARASDGSRGRDSMACAPGTATAMRDTIPDSDNIAFDQPPSDCTLGQFDTTCPKPESNFPSTQLHRRTQPSLWLPIMHAMTISTETIRYPPTITHFKPTRPIRKTAYLVLPRFKSV